MVLACSVGCELIAPGVKRKGVTADGEVEELSGHFLDLLNAGVAKFKYFLTILADQVIMLPVLVRLLELCLLAELMPRNQVTDQQQLDGIIQRGSAHPVLLVFHRHIQRFDIEVTVVRIDLIQNGEAFRCFPVPVLLKVVRKDLPDYTFGFLIRHPSLARHKSIKNNLLPGKRFFGTKFFLNGKNVYICDIK